MKIIIHIILIMILFTFHNHVLDAQDENYNTMNFREVPLLVIAEDIYYGRTHRKQEIEQILTTDVNRAEKKKLKRELRLRKRFDVINIHEYESKRLRRVYKKLHKKNMTYNQNRILEIGHLIDGHNNSKETNHESLKRLRQERELREKVSENILQLYKLDMAFSYHYMVDLEEQMAMIDSSDSTNQRLADEQYGHMVMLEGIKNGKQIGLNLILTPFLVSMPHIVIDDVLTESNSQMEKAIQEENYLKQSYLNSIIDLIDDLNNKVNQKDYQNALRIRRSLYEKLFVDYSTGVVNSYNTINETKSHFKLSVSYISPIGSFGSQATAGSIYDAFNGAAGFGAQNGMGISVGSPDLLTFSDHLDDKDSHYYGISSILPVQLEGNLINVNWRSLGGVWDAHPNQSLRLFGGSMGYGLLFPLQKKSYSQSRYSFQSQIYTSYMIGFQAIDGGGFDFDTQSDFYEGLQVKPYFKTLTVSQKFTIGLKFASFDIEYSYVMYNLRGEVEFEFNPRLAGFREGGAFDFRLPVRYHQFSVSYRIFR